MLASPYDMTNEETNFLLQVVNSWFTVVHQNFQSFWLSFFNHQACFNVPRSSNSSFYFSILLLKTVVVWNGFKQNLIRPWVFYLGCPSVFLYFSRQIDAIEDVGFQFTSWHLAAILLPLCVYPYLENSVFLEIILLSLFANFVNAYEETFPAFQITLDAFVICVVIKTLAETMFRRDYTVVAYLISVLGMSYVQECHIHSLPLASSLYLFMVMSLVPLFSNDTNTEFLGKCMICSMLFANCMLFKTLYICIPNMFSGLWRKAINTEDHPSSREFNGMRTKTYRYGFLTSEVPVESASNNCSVGS